jgi:hypothetical protein
MAQDYDKPENAPATQSENARIAQSDTGLGVAGRRGVLMLGAVAASAVVTIRPALASTAASVLNCKIPIPDPSHAGQHIMADGQLVPADTKGSFAPAPRPVTGEEAKSMMNGASPAGFDPSARQAYVNYIRRLQHGTSGFTCYASLQMPRT